MIQTGIVLRICDLFEKFNYENMGSKILQSLSKSSSRVTPTLLQVHFNFSP